MLCLLVILLLFNFVMPIVNQCRNISIAFSIPIVSFSVFYVLLGKYLYDEMPRLFQSKGICAGILIVCSVWMILMNKLTFPDGLSYLAYGSLPSVVNATMIFALFKGSRGKKTERLWKMDRLCFGVYLIHPVFVNFAYKFLRFTPLEAGKWYPLAMIGFWLFFTLCALIGSWVMRKVKVIMIAIMRKTGVFSGTI